MGTRYTDPDGNVWEVTYDDGRYVTLRNTMTRETQEVSYGELRECFDPETGYYEEEVW